MVSPMSPCQPIERRPKPAILTSKLPLVFVLRTSRFAHWRLPCATPQECKLSSRPPVWWWGVQLLIQHKGLQVSLKKKCTHRLDPEETSPSTPSRLHSVTVWQNGESLKFNHMRVQQLYAMLTSCWRLMTCSTSSCVTANVHPIHPALNTSAKSPEHSHLRYILTLDTSSPLTPWSLETVGSTLSLV